MLNYAPAPRSVVSSRMSIQSHVSLRPNPNVFACAAYVFFCLALATQFKQPVRISSYALLEKLDCRLE
jgi:hypothetical protein